MGKTAWALVLGLTLGAALPPLAAAQTCPSSPPVAASLDTRPYADSRLGFSFAIPANYRAMGTSLGTVQFYDPGTFALVQCLAQRRPLARRPMGTSLEIRALSAPPPDLMTAIQQSLPWQVLYAPRYDPVALGTTEGLRYRYRHALYNVDVSGLAWLAPDGRSLITLEGPANSPVLQLVASTLQQPLAPMQAATDSEIQREIEINPPGLPTE